MVEAHGLQEMEKIEFSDKGIYGCRSLRELIKYFAEEMGVAEGCVIKIYMGK